jgi:hypothetical protein
MHEVAEVQLRLQEEAEQEEERLQALEAQQQRLQGLEERHQIVLLSDSKYADPSRISWINTCRKRGSENARKLKSWTTISLKALVNG